MEWFSDKLISTGFSVFIIGYVVVAKVSERKFRSSAVAVTGKIVKRFPRQHYTSYYVAYDRDGLGRVAEYCGPPMRMLFDEGDDIQILIDPTRPPDTTVPDKISASGSAAGNCSLVDEPIWKLWDVLYLVAAVALLLYTYLR